MTSRSAAVSPADPSSLRAIAAWAAATTPRPYQSTGSSRTPTMAYGAASAGVSTVDQTTMTWSASPASHGLATSMRSTSTSRRYTQYASGTTLPSSAAYAASRQASALV